MATNNPSDLAKKMEEWATKQVVAMQQDLFVSIRDETPVDTGRARDGWENQDIVKIGDTGVIKNDVPYIGWLEFGTTIHAPVAMVRRNIQRVTRQK